MPDNALSTKSAAMVTIEVDRKRVEAKEGISLLKACLDNGHFVPHLCYVGKNDRVSACCRLCFVEIDGTDKPVASCCTAVHDGMIVRTDTPAVRQLQTTALRLLLSVHDVDCKNCPANRKCALQDIAVFLKIGLKPTPFPRRLKEPAIDTVHPCFNYYPNRCVLCGRCVEVCKKQGDRPELTFTKRGFNTVIGFFGRPDGRLKDCGKCRGCIESCPVGALTPKDGLLTQQD